MRATLDAVRQEVEQLTAAMSVVESRRGAVDEVQRRLAETAACLACWLCGRCTHS